MRYDDLLDSLSYVDFYSNWKHTEKPMIYVFKGKDVEKYSRWNDIRKPAKYSFAFEGDLWCQYSLQTRPWVDWAWEDREESQVPKFYINKLALYKALGL